MSDLPPLLCVTGPDGAGKTTQIERLVARLENDAKRKVAAVTIWDLLLDPSTRPKVGFKSPGEVDDYLSMLHPISRALFCFHCLYQALELARSREPELLLVDGYWYKYFATEIAHGGDPVALRKIASIFPEPAMTFYLTLSPTEAYGRKATLSGYETGFDEGKKAEAFHEFQRVSGRVLEELAREFEWRRLDGTETIEALTDEIVAGIDQGNFAERASRMRHSRRSSAVPRHPNP
jgi:thymidylate kinase